MSREEREKLLAKACGFWFVLDQRTREDLIDGKCVYSEYNAVPIIDYTRQHPIFSHG